MREMRKGGQTRLGPLVLAGHLSRLTPVCFDLSQIISSIINSSISVGLGF